MQASWLYSTLLSVSAHSQPEEKCTQRAQLPHIFFLSSILRLFIK